MGNLAIEQRRQPVAASQPVEQFVGSDFAAGSHVSVPIRELLERALPNDLVLVGLKRAEAALIQCKCVGASEQAASAWAFPLSVLLLKVPGLQLGAVPAKVFRRHPMEGSESGHAQPRENLRRDLVKKPGPSAK